MDKMFTAVVIGQLVDEGRLSFQDPVSKFLGGKGWTTADLSKVRVEHLLSHTSGLGSYFNDTYERMARQLLRKVDDYKPLVAEGDARLRARVEVAVTATTGFLLAGAVIEAVTGQGYFDVVRERVYARAGMPNQRQLRHRPRRPEPGDRLLARAGRRERHAVARQHVRARHPRRPGRGRLLDRAGPPRLRRGDAQGEAS